jgi:hypothetical protein
MPGPQDHLQRAVELAFDAMGNQKTEQMLWLGAQPYGALWRLPVLNDLLAIDLSSRCVTTSSGSDVSLVWRILLLHYLAIASRPERLDPQVTFADLHSARTYASVYHKRVIARLCGTAGRDEQRLRTAAESIGGRIVGVGDTSFDFDVFPRLCVRVIWHPADEEFPPSATLLLPANIESYFCIEDIVVLSECLVARLGGRAF